MNKDKAADIGFKITLLLFGALILFFMFESTCN